MRQARSPLQFEKASILLTLILVLILVLRLTVAPWGILTVLGAPIVSAIVGWWLYSNERTESLLASSSIGMLSGLLVGGIDHAIMFAPLFVRAQPRTVTEVCSTACTVGMMLTFTGIVLGLVGGLLGWRFADEQRRSNRHP